MFEFESLRTTTAHGGDGMTFGSATVCGALWAKILPLSPAATEAAAETALTDAATGYGFVYLAEIAMLFATIAAIGPLARATDTWQHSTASKEPAWSGLPIRHSAGERT